MRRSTILSLAAIAACATTLRCACDHGARERRVADDASSSLREIAVRDEGVRAQLLKMLPANVVVERGDGDAGEIAATTRFMFADVNLAGADRRATVERDLHSRFAQTLIWLGDALGDVPRDHITMYMMPLDNHTIAVGDPRMGAQLLFDPSIVLDDVTLQAARFDRAASLLADRGFHVVRFPALVLAGQSSVVSYTDALFDRRGDQRVVYMPTYGKHVLDDTAQKLYESQGFEVRRIDVSRSTGGLGVAVLARE